ncbi:MAG: putative metalloprotease CJM1_0395 family protein [Planctomycetota bacterium]
MTITATNPLSGFANSPGAGSGYGSAPGRRVITVRPVTPPADVRPTERRSPTERPQETQPSQPGRRNEAPRTGTAYQTNADGDSVTLSSKTDQLSDDEQAEVTKLQARDTEVRTHEQAHVSAAGALFRGGPFYEYKTGPDGKEYAVAGRVNIDTSEGNTPEETIAKAQQIRRAALAPAEPSSTDQRVAAEASSMESKARQELAEAQASDETAPATPTTTTSTSDANRRTSNASAIRAATGELKIDMYA